LYRFGDLFTRCGPLNALCHRLVVLVVPAPIASLRVLLCEALRKNSLTHLPLIRHRAPSNATHNYHSHHHYQHGSVPACSSVVPGLLCNQLLLLPHPLQVKSIEVEVGWSIAVFHVVLLAIDR